MDLVTVRELYRNREEYLDKEVTIGDGCAVSVILRHLDLSFVNDGSFFENLQVVYHDNMENFWRNFQAECWCGNHCKRNTCRNTTGKTAI